MVLVCRERTSTTKLSKSHPLTAPSSYAIYNSKWIITHPRPCSFETEKKNKGAVYVYVWILKYWLRCSYFHFYNACSTRSLNTANAILYIRIIITRYQVSPEFWYHKTVSEFELKIKIYCGAYIPGRFNKGPCAVA